MNPNHTTVRTPGDTHHQGKNRQRKEKKETPHHHNRADSGALPRNQGNRKRETIAQSPSTLHRTKHYERNNSPYKKSRSNKKRDYSPTPSTSYNPTRKSSTTSHRPKSHNRSRRSSRRPTPKHQEATKRTESEKDREGTKHPLILETEQTGPVHHHQHTDEDAGAHHQTDTQGNDRADTEAINGTKPEYKEKEQRPPNNPCQSTDTAPCQVAAPNPCQVAATNPCQVAAINPCQVAALNLCQVAALNLCQVAALNLCQVAAINPAKWQLPIHAKWQLSTAAKWQLLTPAKWQQLSPPAKWQLSTSAKWQLSTSAKWQLSSPAKWQPGLIPCQKAAQFHHQEEAPTPCQMADQPSNQVATITCGTTGQTCTVLQCHPCLQKTERT